MQTKEKVLSTARKGGFKHNHYSETQIDRLNESHLDQFLCWYDGDMLYQRGNQFYCAVRGTEFVLYGNKAYDYYTGATYFPLAFLQRYLDYDFPAALYLLNHFYRKVNKAEVQAELDGFVGSAYAPHPAPIVADLEAFVSDNRLTSHEAYERTYAYLHNTRGIARPVISNFISQQFLTMDSKGNLCFITYRDPLNKKEVIAVTRKGTTATPFKSNQVKEAHTGFFFAQKEALAAASYEEVFVFEAVADLMAYLSLIWDKRITESQRHSPNRCYISLNGAGNQQYVEKVLHQYPSIQRVSLCLDNDQSGIKGSRRIASKSLATIPDGQVYDLRADGLKVLSTAHGYCKDWNDVVRLPVHDLGVIV